MTTTFPTPAASLGGPRTPVIDKSPPRRCRRIGLARALQWIAVIWIGVAALIAGVELRQWAFTATQAVRFRTDIDNALRQGGAVYYDAMIAGRANDPPTLPAILQAYVARYDKVVVNGRVVPTRGYARLDYPPARLLVMTLWSRTVLADGRQGWNDTDLQPLLRFNAVLEFMGAMAVFFLVRHWRMKSHGPGTWNAMWLPLIGGGLLWFNLAVIMNGHMWPQWDIWLLPWFLWACYFGSRNWWLAAGMTIGLGCMFKGQLLLGSPVLILWPLFMGNWGAVVRASVGLMAGVALAASPWLLAGSPHRLWLMAIAFAGVGCVVMGQLLWRWRAPEIKYGMELTPSSRRRQILTGAAVVAAALLVLWPWMGGYRGASPQIGLLIAGIVLLPMVYPRSLSWPTWCAALLGMGLWTGAMLFDGSFSWLKAGFLLGTDNYQTLSAGAVYNLGSILQRTWGWGLKEPVDWSGQTMQTTLRWVYGGATLLVGIAAAMQARRQSPRLLVALVAQWVVMYAVLGQMHERYILYGAAFSAALVAVSFGMTLMHLLLTAISAAGMWQTMERGPLQTWYLPELGKWIYPMHPGAGWMVMLIAAMFIVFALMPERRGRRSHAKMRSVDPHAGAMRLIDE